LRLYDAHRNSISDDNPYYKIDDDGDDVGVGGKDAMHCLSTIPNAIPFAMIVPIFKSMVVLVMEVL